MRPYKLYIHTNIMETETVLAGKQATAERPKATQKQIDEAAYLGIPIDEYGVPIGVTVDVAIDKLYDRLNAHFGFDIRTLRRR
ncbi:hypothetical protein Barb7_03097 [Bacteroidales bacterium Barb7]|nr:hypothetical protein Barb4_00097 [Bacteroidales bacterium Barb4]OAV72470.1 hypothetical protein Barb7_03097 [Bacteroidales bacterium Barb7]